ncbi:cysteine synthase A [Natronocella acetinitrilica]|uniref:cysteine synthase n=1 Tax=Natronocella acetinitrilica TaxID=414046 RepID=A0AAE3G744_9GAMM|nr:cysteine synthase A [Natronocella acetinitrilica]MCP1677095.1 cysteine synthase A [Natronocella acetinitrilica]
MSICNGFAGAIGNTPLIRLRHLSDETGCEILGKAEFMNPGGSVKDRAALFIIEDAERRGALRPGGVVVEGTAGNTGIGLAHICNARGYRCVIVIPETQSQEKIDLLRTLGAEVHTVPAKPYKDPNNYQKIAGRMAGEMDNAIWANQFDNVANRQAHAETTGPELWRDTDGGLSAFTCATGTGGTLAGVARYLKAQSEHVRCVLADPSGSALFRYVKTGTPEVEGSGSITEGIGSTRVTSNLEGTPLDDAYSIPDQEAVSMVYRLLHEEGLFLGSSSGVNVVAAVRLARDLGPGHTIATILCDGGSRYYSRLFNAEWLAGKGLRAGA